jgi:tripartite-type tricarboxylate transporter receptor subunit TctC
VNLRRNTARQALSVFLAASLALSTASVYAQKAAPFPERPVRLLVPFAPGGALDLIGRALAKGLTELWGQSMVVDNKPGAGGLIAADLLAKSPGDGHTLLLSGDTLTILPFLHDKMPYDTLTDLVPVGLVSAVPLVLVAHPGTKFRNLADVVAAARAQPDGITYASSGTGAPHHISMERFQRAAGITLKHIPYKGGSPALADVAAGRVAMMFSGVSTALAFIKEGRLVALAVGTAERAPQLRDVPTLAEAGFPTVEASPWTGVIAPRGTPIARVEKISADIEKVVRGQAFHDAVVPLGNEVRSSTRQAFAERFRNEYESNRALVKAAGIKAE